MPAREVAIAEVSRAMLALKRGVVGEIERRDLSASGAMVNSLEDEVTSDETSITGTLTALDYWVNVGSGTPPGGDVTERDIAKWMDDKGFEARDGVPIRALAWFIARKIRREGSKDFRTGRPNAFDTAIDVWAASAEVKELGNRTANEYGDSYVEILRTNLAR